MKKYLLSIIALAFACGAAHAAITVTTANIPQPANDTLLFALPVDVEHYQDIQNYPDADPDSRMMKFQPEYLVTARDFTRGDTNKGTATLPANAKVIGLALDGYDVATDYASSKGVYLDVTAWCRNIPAGQMELDNFDELLEGYKTNKPKGDLFTDTVLCRGARNIPGYPGYHCVFDPEANDQNPGTIVDIPFNNPDEDGNLVPFWYKGENIYLTLWMINCEDIHMKYRYMAYDDAEAETASLMRSGTFCFSDATYEYIADYFGVMLMYDLPKHRLPAFRTPYFTNDIRITVVEGNNVFYELQDADGNVIDPAEDGNYYSLDHTKQYVLYIDNNEGVELAFENMYQDINVEIKKGGTAVEEIGAAKSVARVDYYNLAGQQSAQPVNGVNIVVTTYTDGTTSTAKVVK
jgi:hypothetical protein